MKKEGAGKPQNPDIALDADVRMRGLHFEKVPNPKVYFRGNTGRNSVWESRRENLPNEVRDGVVYRNARVRLLIASEIINNDPDFLNSLDKERVRTNLEHREDERPESRKPRTKSKEEKK
jgi:phage terminase large subunit GpA-like protein